MPGEQYTRKEIDVQIVGINEKLCDHKRLLEAIHEQTIKTNGRVTESEKDVIEVTRCINDLYDRTSTLQSWRDRSVGGLAVLTTLAVPVFLYVVYIWLG